MRPIFLSLASGLVLLAACPSPTTSGDDDDSSQGDDDDDDSASSSVTLPPGLTEMFITQQVDGVPVARRVLLHVPEEVDPKRDYPLVFAFHGNGGTADGWPMTFAQEVEAGAFVGMYPDGHLNSWNLGEEDSTADDVAFFGMMTDVLRSYGGIDGERLFAVGGSNGAGMVQKLAVEGTPLRGIAALSTALIQGQGPTSATPGVSVMQVHGVDDDVCPYGGGPSVTGHVFMPAEESAAAWAAHNGCDPDPIEEELVPGHTRLTWPNCAEGRQVVHDRLEGVGHGLPGNFMGVGPARAAWQFFDQL